MSLKVSTDTDINTVLKNLSQNDFKQFGLEYIAYIRPVVANNQKAYAIHAADGHRLSVMETLQEAVLAAKMSDLEPITVH